VAENQPYLWNLEGLGISNLVYHVWWPTSLTCAVTWPPTWKVSVAVQVTTCRRGRGPHYRLHTWHNDLCACVLICSHLRYLTRYQRQLFCVNWWDHTTNEVICKQTKLASLQNSYREGIRYVTIWSYCSTWCSCPCTSSLVSGDEHFSRMESGYQLEEPAGSIQENMDLSDSGWYWYVNAHLLGCLHTSWPWKRDATVSEDYALMMMMISNTRTLTFDGTEWPCLMFMLKAITQCRESDNFRGSGWIPVVCPG